MKCFKIISVAGVLLLASLVYSADITFSTSGTIGAGDIYDVVYLENNDTVVDMTGGQIGKLWLYDNSTFNMSGGNITGGIDAHGTSYFDISGGTIDIESVLVLYGDGGCFSGGRITADGLKTGKFSMVKIDGGELSFGTFYIDGDLIITGGVLEIGELAIADDSIISIYSGNYSYNLTNEILTGYLIDGSYFSIGGVNQSKYDRINFVPEPMTLILFGLGGLFLKRPQ